jgi:hypothetical protein
VEQNSEESIAVNENEKSYTDIQKEPLSQKQAVARIEKLFAQVLIKLKSEEMWQELNSKYKALPTAVRSSFVKMWATKIT